MGSSMRSLIVKVKKWYKRKPTQRELDRLMIASLATRLNTLEKNQAAIVKRLLAVEASLKNAPRAASLTAKVIQAKSDEHNKGLNDNKPTIH